MKKPEFDYNEETLRERPRNPEELIQYVSWLKAKLDLSRDVLARVNCLGELGFYLRCIGDLDNAEENLLEALRLIRANGLGAKKETQQEIRLAHVYQWQKEFEKSNELFGSILARCQSDSEAQVYLDFALQHAGKNFFDQGRFEFAVVCFTKALKIREQSKAPADQIASTRHALRVAMLKLSGAE